MNRQVLIERLTQELQDIRQRGLAREIKDLHYLDAVTARDQSGKKYLVFASNNYLGLTFASEVRQAAAAAALQQGTGSTGSRLTTGGVGAATNGVDFCLAHGSDQRQLDGGLFGFKSFRHFIGQLVGIKKINQ